MRSFILVLWGLSIGALGGCDGGGMMVGGDDDVVDPPDPVTLTFVTPASGTRFDRDHLEPMYGWRATQVAVEVATTGDGVASIDLAAGDLALGSFDAQGKAEVLLIDAGLETLTATARDAAGAPLATATIDVVVADPPVANCRAWLDLYRVPYTVASAMPGVVDPVNVTTPINGMPFRYLTNTNRRTTFFMDCSLARSLVLAAPFWRLRGVVEVADIGVYNYRCIGTGTPPNCPQGMSQHAYAKAIDLAEFKTTDGTKYNVETDWIIDPDTEETCAAPTANDKDAWLHQLICDLKGDSVWNIVLTPNYNASHRNHFHVDLTTGSNFIEREAPRAIDDGPDDF